MVKEIKILASKSVYGKWTEEDPYRNVYEFYTHDWEQIMRLSELKERQTEDDLFSRFSLGNIIKEFNRM